jgi:hypothetical protein
MKLRIANDLALDGDLVVATTGIFATKGMGKSYLAQVMAEEMLEHGQVIVVIDPTDVWSGLRSSADGKSDGYPILVIGGDHGDLKLDPEPGAGVRLAEAIVAERFSCVICTDGLDDTSAIRYVREVLSTIYKKNRKPLHVFVDECDIFAPQQSKEEEDHRCIRAMAHVVRRGRKKGIGSTLITQRPSELNASVRSQVEMLFVLGLLHHLDIDAVERWLRLRKKKRGGNAAFELQEEMIESLDSLQRGDAWLWAPRLKIHRRFRARAKRTFDSGATPKPGQKARKAKKLAAVDIARLGTVIAEAAKRQKENDPSELRRQVAALRKELTDVGKGHDRAEINEKSSHAENVKLRDQLERLKKAPKSFLKDIQIDRLEKIVDRASRAAKDAEKAISSAFAKAAVEIGKMEALLKERLLRPVDETLPPRPAPARNGNGLQSAYVDAFRGGGARQKAPTPVAKPTPLKKRAEIAVRATAVDGLQPAHLRLLSGIAWWESLGVSAPDLGGVAFAAKTSTKSSAFNNNRAKLHAAGYIEYPSNGYVRLTEAGRAIAPPPSLPPTNEAFQRAVLDSVQPAIQRLLSVLIAEYPNEVSLEEFAERAGTSVSSSAFNNNRSWLRARGLAEYPRNGFVRATPLLFPEAS